MTEIRNAETGELSIPVKAPWIVRLRCRHDWWPVGFCDWACVKCGAER